MKEYKVLTRKDEFFFGGFDPAKLEAVMNTYARQGWRVVTWGAVTIPGYGATKDELITVMERDI